MSSSWAAALLSAAIMKRKENPLEAFKRTAEIVDNEHEKALQKLQCVADELIQEIEKKLKP